MTSPTPQTALSVLHGRLEVHFAHVASIRASSAPGMPVFALEHGLSEAELSLLRQEVVEAVRQGTLPRDNSLPFVVYAAEIGYEFSGDEYWQTFAARTPGWVELGNDGRHYIRRRFREFRDRFSGAEPSGPWAEQFSIICWPITHAVLPTDLQRHLARLLFDYRRLLTMETLDDPNDLGRRLAARAWHASSRFQTFAQNTRLLGQVAAALLAGEDEDSPFLLTSTLSRIVADLSKERMSQRWLQDAKSTARQVRTRGFLPTGGGRQAEAGTRRGFVASTDPDLFLSYRPDGWSLYIELPDLAALTERLPIIGEELGRLRPQISGVTRRFAGGHLLYPGQYVRASSWPGRDMPLIQLESGSAVANELLADQCIMSPGPAWLFRCRGMSMAREVRGRFVRPGHEYVLVLESPLNVSLPSWVSETPSATEGVVMFRLRPPAQLEESDLAAVAELGLRPVIDIEVRPVGYVPASWDGEGSAEWLEGEQPLIAVRSSRSVAQCIMKVGKRSELLPWPDESDEIIIGISGLRSGTHTVQVALIPPEAETPVAEGTLDVVIRPPSIRPASGTPGEGMMILASPARPTLEELWDGRGFLEFLGPTSSPLRVTMEFTDRSGRSLVKRSAKESFRVGRSQWAELFNRSFQRIDEVHRKYDQAEACIITAAAPGIGTASIRCDRAFVALRWAFGRDADGPHVTLVDNTEGARVTATAYDFATPTEARQIAVESGGRLRWPGGGLAVATDGTQRAAVILPPRVRTLEDLRMQQIEVPQSTKSKEGVKQVVDTVQLWATASLPSDPFAAARRLEVVQVLVTSIASVIGGQRWAKAERTFSASSRRDLGCLREAITTRADQRKLVDDLSVVAEEVKPLGVEERVGVFAWLLREHGVLPRREESIDILSESVLRLASEPWTLLEWSSGSLDESLDVILDLPVMLRAARFVVLATSSVGDVGESTDAGWLWP